MAQSGPSYDLGVRGGRFLAAQGSIPEGSTILIRQGRIAAIAALGERVAAARVIDGSGRIVMPGLVNAHTHAAMSLFRGFAPDNLPLAEWLGRIWPAEAASVRPEMVYRCTLLACCEMLVSGTTLLADGYFFEEEVARAAEVAGIRAVCAQAVLDPAAPDAKAGQGLARLRAFLAGFPEGSGLVRAGVFCHSVYTCSEETLLAAHEIARDRGCLFFVHVSETAEEVRNCVREHGLSPLRLLGKLGLLGPGCVAVHAVRLDEAEIELLAASGAAAVHCPESNMKLASGVAAVPLMMGHGVRVALGTDSPASNDDQDMLREAAAGARLITLSGRKPREAARMMLRAATSGGADALGLECGRLEPGALADLVILEPGWPGLWPQAEGDDALAEQVVFCAGGADVRTVIVGGEVVVEEGRLTRVDIDEVMAGVRELAKKLR